MLRVQRVGVVGPTFDRKVGFSGIGVPNLEERHRRKVVIYSHGDNLCERSRLSFHDEPDTRPEAVFCALMILRAQEKSGPGSVGGRHRLRRRERPHHSLGLAKKGNRPAA
jgi:hypothetical protein